MAAPRDGGGEFIINIWERYMPEAGTSDESKVDMTRLNCVMLGEGGKGRERGKRGTGCNSQETQMYSVGNQNDWII